jgi:DNA-binding transcriptional ArsR family regulator
MAVEDVTGSTTQASPVVPDVFFAISDPTRRAVLDFLTRGPRNAGNIVSQFPELTQPGVSRHLRVLREAQLVTVTIEAQQRIYTLKPEGLKTLNEWISKYQEFWSSKLDALEAHLNATRTRKRAATRKK